MHEDFETAGADSAIDTDICVIGGGAAGITAARRLLALGHSVTLLESGGLDYEADTAALNQGRIVGEDYYELDHARLRFFGGTTAIWGGRVAQLDPIDLRRRPWVPHSGWPIGWDELSAYYGPARAAFGLAPSAPAPKALGDAGIALPEFSPGGLEIGLWTFDRRFNRFVFEACGDLVDHPRARIVTHATATRIALHRDGRAVEAVKARALTGHELTVKPRAVILAAGGLENPRLLLASDDVHAGGLGNAHDQVGRYFMEHPHTRGGRVIGGGVWPLLKAFGRPHRIGGQELAALVKPSEAMQAQEGILNTSLTIAARQPPDARQAWAMQAYGGLKHQTAPTKAGRALWMMTKRGATWAQRRADPFRPWLLNRLGLRDLALVVRAEQAPNPDSRVVLTKERDALGLPRLALDWRMSPIDRDSVAALVRGLGAELGRLGTGRVEPAAWLSEEDAGWQTDPLISAHPIGGYHHMGTTRMSASPREGVVDADSRVHGIGNLYVAGSSVFPTSGWANPTLTIVALALRAAEHLSASVARPVTA
ncbi:FAD-dependent oxidoreductase [Parvularcula oceani]|uniref:FAD-dependent oxidoreductase n=1 Tax=Parvularcula oceani TaxID=1247963 RepID=UPI0004E1A826|nr:GMC family oxidoreductase [Parvularcula oceani]